MVVQHPKPSGGTSASRRVRVTAKDGAGAVEGEAVFTQQARSYRRMWAILLVLTGVLLVVLGVMEYADGLQHSDVDGAVGDLVDDAKERSTPDDKQAELVGAVAALGVVLLASVIMLFGLIGRTGRSIRIASIFAALAAVGAMVAKPDRERVRPDPDRSGARVRRRHPAAARQLTASGPSGKWSSPRPYLKTLRMRCNSWLDAHPISPQRCSALEYLRYPTRG